jgi:hypothetical protein
MALLGHHTHTLPPLLKQLKFGIPNENNFNTHTIASHAIPNGGKM